MTTFGQVRKWQASQLDEAEQRLKSHSDTLLGLTDELAATIKPVGWVGEGAQAATGERDHLADGMEHIVAEVNAARAALMAASDGAR